jgi:hypothetical protein
VIDRCESLGVVIGIEAFTTDVEPPCRATLEEIEISSVPGYDWARADWSASTWVSLTSRSAQPTMCLTHCSIRTQNRKASQTDEKEKS